MLFLVFAGLCITSTLVECSYRKYGQSEPRYGFPVNRKTQYPFKTYEPVSLISCEAYPVYLPPLEITYYEDAKLRGSNTGYWVNFSPENFSLPSAYLTGGPVFDEKYSLESISYVADGYPNNTRIGDCVDGVGSSCGFHFTFANERYGGNNNSWNYRDGLVELIFEVLVRGTVDNPDVQPLLDAIYRIKEANSNTIINVKDALYWGLKWLPTGPYFVYPGAIKSDALQQFFCTIDIKPVNIPWMSYRQWETFGKVKDLFGQPQYNAQAVHPMNGRPLVEACSPVYLKAVRGGYKPNGGKPSQYGGKPSQYQSQG